jgi:hypothetical protein
MDRGSFVICPLSLLSFLGVQLVGLLVYPYVVITNWAVGGGVMVRTLGIAGKQMMSSLWDLRLEGTLFMYRDIVPTGLSWSER